MSNERIITLQLQLNPDLFELPKETKIGSKNRIFREIWNKFQVVFFVEFAS